MNNLQHLNPSEFDHKTYYNSLEGRNRLLHAYAAGEIGRSNVATIILSALDQYESKKVFEIATVGSDGRHEKGPHSPIDVVVYLDIDLEEKSKNALLQDIKVEIEPISLLQRAQNFIKDSGEGFTDVEEKIAPINIPELEQTLIKNGRADFADVEVKNVNGNVLFYRETEGDNLMWPSRIHDSKSLYWNETPLILKAKNRLYDLYTQFGRKIQSIQKDRLRDHRVVSVGGKNTPYAQGKNKFKGEYVTHFDVQELNAIFFDPNTTQAGFKYGPLRLVQTFLQYQITKYINSERAYKEVLLHLPNNTLDRISYMQADGLLNGDNDKVEALRDNYKFFLWWYHRSEFEYRYHNNTEIKLIEPEVQDIRKRLVTLASTVQEMKSINYIAKKII